MKKYPNQITAFLHCAEFWCNFHDSFTLDEIAEFTYEHMKEYRSKNRTLESWKQGTKRSIAYSYVPAGWLVPLGNNKYRFNS